MTCVVLLVVNMLVGEKVVFRSEGDLSIRGEVLSENRYVSPVRPVLFGVPV